MAPAQGQFTDPPPPQQPAYAAVPQQPAYAAVQQQPVPSAPVPAPAPERERDGGRESRRRRSPSPRRDRDRDRDSRCVLYVCYLTAAVHEITGKISTVYRKRVPRTRGKFVSKPIVFNFVSGLVQLGANFVLGKTVRIRLGAILRVRYRRASDASSACAALFGKAWLLGAGYSLRSWHGSRPGLMGCPDMLLCCCCLDEAYQAFPNVGRYVVFRQLPMYIA